MLPERVRRLALNKKGAVERRGCWIFYLHFEARGEELSRNKKNNFFTRRCPRSGAPPPLLLTDHSESIEEHTQGVLKRKENGGEKRQHSPSKVLSRSWSSSVAMFFSDSSVLAGREVSIRSDSAEQERIMVLECAALIAMKSRVSDELKAGNERSKSTQSDDAGRGESF